jgi:hypothetical protein
MSDAVEVMLGRLYEPNMWDVRKQVARARRSGQAVVFVDLRVPINSTVVRLALRSRDLYLIGIRNGTGIWYEFEPDTQRSDPGSAASGSAMLPGSRWIRVGSRSALSSYVALHLRQLIATGANRYAETPTSLVAFFSGWDGRIDIDYTRLRVCVLTFAICEALRFRSIETAARNWVSPPPSMPAGHWPVFEITSAMLDLAQSWGDRARSGDADVQTWLPGMPDLLVD